MGRPVPEPEPRACPFCGSADTHLYADGSGACANCGRAFRGTAPVGRLLAGEQVARRTGARREKVRVGVLGVLGGLVGLAGVPAVFLVGAAIHGQSVATWTATVFNQPNGALACGGASLLVVFSVYAMWAGFVVWRGFAEKTVHLILAGALTAFASALAGQGLAGIVGILAGALALVGGLLAWLGARAKEEDAGPETAAT